MSSEGISAREVAMQIEPGAVLEGELVLPQGATALVLFAAGPGCSALLDDPAFRTRVAWGKRPIKRAGYPNVEWMKRQVADNLGRVGGDSEPEYYEDETSSERDKDPRPGG